MSLTALYRTLHLFAYVFLLCACVHVLSAVFVQCVLLYVYVCLLCLCSVCMCVLLHVYVFLLCVHEFLLGLCMQAGVNL